MTVSATWPFGIPFIFASYATLLLELHIFCWKTILQQRNIENENGKGDEETLADKSALCRLDVREVRLVSTEQGLLLCSVIFPNSIPSSP